MVSLLKKYKPGSKGLATLTSIALVAILMFNLSAVVGAAGHTLTGTVRNQSNSNSTVSGAYVYATAPSDSGILYGPVTTNASGYYSLPVSVSGTYDIYFVPPANIGATTLVESNVSITASQVIDRSFSSQINTLSGVLTDGAGNPLSGVTIKLLRANTPIYQATTNSSGGYSISAPANYYFLNLSGSMANIPNFTLNQQNSSSVNLMSGDQTLDMSIKTATMTVTPRSNDGKVLWNYQGVSARAVSGITSLYPGDPGTTISLVNSTGFNASTGTSGTITTIVGATYTASGLESSSYTTSVCQKVTSASTGVYDCLRTPLTVKSDISFDLPSTSPAVRTFSGTLKDGAGVPISGASITLFKHADSSTYATTDANGNFSIKAMPKKYSLKINKGYTLTQNSANPAIDLTFGDVTLDLQVPTTTLTVSAYDASGSPLYGRSVNAQANSGTAFVYPGDPGMAISNLVSNFSTSYVSNVGSLDTITGAVYTAKGLNASNSSGSLCSNSASGVYDCLTTAYTVTGPANIRVPY